MIRKQLSFRCKFVGTSAITITVIDHTTGETYVCLWEFMEDKLSERIPAKTKGTRRKSKVSDEPDMIIADEEDTLDD